MIIEAVAEHFGRIEELLEGLAPCYEINMSFGEKLRPLGLHRLKLIEFVNLVLKFD